MTVKLKVVPPYRINVGCGRNIQEGFVNIDSSPLPGVDIVCNLDRVRETPIDLPSDSAEFFMLSHVIEHIHDSLGLMQELWRLAMPNATAIIRVPHGSSDDAWEDPTHIRPYFHGSFGYFSQPYYWRADYGYRGDWQPKKIRLFVAKSHCEGMSEQQIIESVNSKRNFVAEMVCELYAVKPMRSPQRELQVAPDVELTLV